MEQYVDKAALVAEIEELYKKWEMGNFVYEKLISFLDALEVKEVDLEKETKKWWKERLHLNPKNQLWMDAHQSVELAKHFFELGLKAQKGE